MAYEHSSTHGAYSSAPVCHRGWGYAAKSANGYRHVWVVYDTDDFPASHIDETARLCEADSNDETTYHAIWSNQCVELWFLLHFSFMQSDLHRSEYWPKLTEILKSLGEGEYRKNRDDMYRILYPHMNDAIVNAKKLEEINKGKTPSKSAPGTMIHKLVEKLEPYLTSNKSQLLMDLLHSGYWLFLCL